MMQLQVNCEFPGSPARAVGVRAVGQPTQTPPFRGEWQSPGSLIASACSKLPAVLLVAERYEGNRHSVLVVLREDPEDVLDAIYDAEARTIRELRNIPFDMRVTVPQGPWTSDRVSNNYLVRYMVP